MMAPLPVPLPAAPFPVAVSPELCRVRAGGRTPPQPRRRLTFAPTIDDEPKLHVLADRPLGVAREVETGFGHASLASHS